MEMPESTDIQAQMRFEPPASRKTIKRGSASVLLHEALRERIVSLELIPGEYLSRSEIAAQYDVSQTPVRDAMMRLEEEGLLVIYPQSKTLVSKIDVTHAQETQFLRLSIELEVVRTLIRQEGKAQIAKARTCLALQRAALGSDDLLQFSRLDREFHAAICEAAGVANLWTIVTARSGHIDRLRKLNLPDPGKSSSILSCHERILRAIDDRDDRGAEAVLREHLSGTLSQVEQIIERYPGYF